MPSVLKEKEMELRKQLGARIVRGKSDVAIHFEADAAEARHELNGPVIEKYVEALRRWQKDRPPTGNLLSRRCGSQTPCRSRVKHLTTKRGKVSTPCRKYDQFDASRHRGRHTSRGFLGALGHHRRLGGFFGPAVDAVEAGAERIRTNLEETVDRAALDEGRFEQEVLYYIEKMDVSEERTRLCAHIVYFRDIMNTGSAQGKARVCLPRWGVKSTPWAARRTTPNSSASWSK